MVASEPKKRNFFTVQKVPKYGFFFWSVFSRIWTEYRDLFCDSPYPVQIRKNKDQKKLSIGTLFTQRFSCFIIFWCLKTTKK